MIRRIHQVATDVARQAHGNGNDAGSDDVHVPLERPGWLTPREIQLIQAMADGRSTSKISSALGIKPATVRSHVKSLLAKLGLHSRVGGGLPDPAVQQRSPIGQPTDLVGLAAAASRPCA